jgi:hypothetical protein
MRDPRFESVSIGLHHPCRTAVKGEVIVRWAMDDEKKLEAKLIDLSTGNSSSLKQLRSSQQNHQASFELPLLARGGYAVQVTVGGKTFLSRKVFACDEGAVELADVRPDNERLAAIAEATGGDFEMASSADKLDLPRAQRVRTHRAVAQLTWPWLWALLAAAGLGAHWWLRRRAGFG